MFCQAARSNASGKSCCALLLNTTRAIEIAGASKHALRQLVPQSDIRSEINLHLYICPAVRGEVTQVVTSCGDQRGL